MTKNTIELTKSMIEYIRTIDKEFTTKQVVDKFTNEKLESINDFSEPMKKFYDQVYGYAIELAVTGLMEKGLIIKYNDKYFNTKTFFERYVSEAQMVIKFICEFDSLKEQSPYTDVYKIYINGIHLMVKELANKGEELGISSDFTSNYLKVSSNYNEMCKHLVQYVNYNNIEAIEKNIVELKKFDKDLIELIDASTRKLSLTDNEHRKPGNSELMNSLIDLNTAKVY